MGYRGNPKTKAQSVGQCIYHGALDDRRGYRPDQIGIDEDDEVWGEIFEAIGMEALCAVAGSE